MLYPPRFDVAFSWEKLHFPHYSARLHPSPNPIPSSSESELQHCIGTRIVAYIGKHVLWGLSVFVGAFVSSCLTCLYAFASLHAVFRVGRSLVVSALSAIAVT